MGYTIKIGQASMDVPTQEEADLYGCTTISVVIKDPIARLDPSYTGWSEFCEEVGIERRNSNFWFHDSTRMLRKQDLDFLDSILAKPLDPDTRKWLVWLRDGVKEALETCSIPAISFD